MLCQFSVKNYRSVKDEIVLDMQATPISEHEESLIIDKDQESFLPIAAIYGPNGSGKSNALNAINNLVAKVMSPVCSICEVKDCSNKNLKVVTPPFKFDQQCLDLPTEFTVFFRTKKAEYRYILKLQRGIVTYESLHKKNIDGVRYTALFLREHNKSSQMIALYGALKKLQTPQDISDNIALLSFFAITNKRNETIKDVFHWFEHDILFKNFSDPFSESRILVPEGKEELELTLNLLKEMDIDITDLRLEETEKKVEVYTKHKVADQEYELTLREESNGTKKAFGFLPDIIESLQYGRTLVVDELDSKLHPALIKYIIQLFTNKEINKNGAQLIFTSHDLANMNNEVYRRDEIWFVAKNNEQASCLYSLMELKDEDGNSIRKDARYDKQYLQGKYGADPYLKKIIDWGDYHEKRELEKTT